MSMLEKLRRALDWDTDDYRNIPDYSDIIDYLGFTAENDPEDVRDAIENEIDALGESEGGDDVSAET